MKSGIILFAGLAAVVLLACGSGAGKALARYDGGEITGADLDRWITARRYPRHVIMEKKEHQRNILAEMALHSLTLERARKDGYAHKPETVIILDTARRHFQASYYKRYLENAAPYEIEAVELVLFAFPVPRMKTGEGNGKKVPYTDRERQELFDVALMQARNVLDDVTGGMPVQEAVKKWTRQGIRGGRQGFVTRQFQVPEIIDAAFALTPGTWYPDPVVTSRGVYMFQTLSRVMINEQNAKKIISNKNEREEAESRFRKELARVYEKQLIEKYRDRLDLSILDNPGSRLLYEVGEKTMTSDDFRTIVDVVTAKRDLRSLEQMTVSDEMEKELAERFFIEDVMGYDLEKNRLHTTDRFEDELQVFLETTLVSNYLNDRILGGVQVTDEELNAKASQLKETGPASMAGARNRLYHELLEHKRGGALRMRNEALLNEVNFTVYPENLAGD